MHCVNRIKQLEKSPYVNGRTVEQLFPSVFIKKFPYYKAKESQCILCLGHMTHHELFPPDKITPRPMHQHCFEEWIWEITEECPICGEYLPNSKLQGQERHIKDIHYRICDGRCMDYYAYVASIVVGYRSRYIIGERSAVSKPKGFFWCEF